MRILVFFSSMLLLMPLGANAQLDKYAPTAVRVGADAGNFGYALLKDGRRFWEFTADIDVYRYLLVTDYGFTKFASSKETYDYESTGRYLRIGPEVNFLKNQTGDVLFFGIKYGTSTFSEDITYQTVNDIDRDNIWPVEQLETSNINVKANWVEFNAGLKARVVDNVYLGFTARYKFLPSVSGGGKFSPYYLPGYGKKTGRDIWGLSYYITYRIPFRKRKKNYFKEAAKEKEQKAKERRQQQQRQGGNQGSDNRNNNMNNFNLRGR